MKKTLIALAVASVAATPVMADETSNVFGEIKYEAGVYDGSAEHSYEGTRFGVKGSKDLGNGLTGKYIIMGNIGGKPGGSLGLNENNYVALAGGFGEVRFGRADTPLKESVKPFRAFTDTIADRDFAKPARWARQDGVHFQTKMGDMKLHVNYSPNGNDMNANMGASLIYKADALYVSAAYEVIAETLTKGKAAVTPTNVVDTNGNVIGTFGGSATTPDVTKDSFNNMSLGIHYKMGAFGAGVLYQALNDGDNTEITIPVTFKMTAKTQLNAAVMLSDYDAKVFSNKTSNTGTDFAVGVEHFFDKKTKLFANVWSGDRTEVVRGTDGTGVGIGMSRKF
jgi:predicted porin